MESTLDMLGEIGSKEEIEAYNDAIKKALGILNEEILQEVFRKHPIIKKLQRNAVEEELTKTKSGSAKRLEVNEDASLSFQNRQAAVILRQVFVTIMDFLNHACVIEELISGDSDEEKDLFRLRIAQMLGLQMYDMMQDLTCAHPDLSILSWRPPGH